MRLDDVDSLSLADADEPDGADYLIASLAGAGGVALFTSPLVLHARPAFATTLEQQGLLRRDQGAALVDAQALLRSETRFALADPEQSDAALLFAGLATTLLGGEAAALAALASRVDDEDDLEAFLEADPYARAARVGFESELYRAAAADPGGWAEMQAARPDATPVTLYLRPTVYAVWTFTAASPAAQALGAALLTPELQSMAQLRHGLRGPQRQSGAGESFQAGARLPAAPTDVAALPDLATLRRLATQLAAG